MVRVRDVMTRGVLTVSPELPLRDLVELVGILTTSDITRPVARGRA